MSRGVRESIVLAASPERVWALVMDPSQLARWVTTHDSLEEEAGPGPLDAGDEFTQRLRLAGKSFRVHWRVEEADRPRLARWVGEGPAGSTAHVVYRLSGDDGETRFDYENEFALPGGVLGRAAGGLLAAAPGSREARRSLERLRDLLSG
jgi:carbon monoxide dehydrogenase subunit G